MKEIDIKPQFTIKSEYNYDDEIATKSITCTINEILKFELKDLVKNGLNEKDLINAIEFVNDKLALLNNFINKIVKEKYEYFYTYIDKLSKIKETTEWNSYDIVNIEEKYNISYNELKEKEKNIISLINEKNCLIEIEKIIKLYEILDIEVKKISNEIKDQINLDDIHFIQLNKYTKGVTSSCVIDITQNSTNKNSHFELNNKKNGNNITDVNITDVHIGDIHINDINITDINITDININKTSGSSNLIVTGNNTDDISSFTNLNFNSLVKFIKKINFLHKFIAYYHISNVNIIKLKIKKLKFYEKCIIEIVIDYLSKNFFLDDNYESKVKCCLDIFFYLNVEENCLLQVIQNKINKVNSYIHDIKSDNNNNDKNIKNIFFLILQTCKNGIDEICYINEVIKMKHIDEMVMMVKETEEEEEEEEEEKKKKEEKEEKLFLSGDKKENKQNGESSEKKKTKKYNYNSVSNDYKRRIKHMGIDIYIEFYLPYITILKNNKINELVKKKKDMLYVLNLCEEFINIIKYKIDYKSSEKDILLNLFNKEYEEITFNSFNKLVNQVQCLFQKMNIIIPSNSDYDGMYNNNLPTVSDIQKYVDAFYNELYIYIYYPYIFTRIISTCNNSLLLLSNNLNNLKKKLNLHIDVDTKNKQITIDYTYKNFKFNLELFLISKQLLIYLINTLKKLKKEIIKIKIKTYKMCCMYYSSDQIKNKNLSDRFLSKGEEKYTIMADLYKQNMSTIQHKITTDHSKKKIKTNGVLHNILTDNKNLIALSFDEFFFEFFTFQDYLNSYFCNSGGDSGDDGDDGDDGDGGDNPQKNELKKEHINYKKIANPVEIIKKETIFEENKKEKNNNKNDSFSNKMEVNNVSLLNKSQNCINPNLFELDFLLDFKHNFFNLNNSYNIFDNDEEKKNYELNSLFIKEKCQFLLKKKKKKKKIFFDLNDLEKGINEFNNAVNSCIHECFECFEKTSNSFLKTNCNIISTIDVHSLFDKLCVHFYNNIIQNIPLYECTYIINNLINKILVYLIAISAYYLINDMDLFIFKYYKSLEKITNATNAADTTKSSNAADATNASSVKLSFLNFNYKLCYLFKKSINIKNKKEPYQDIPSFFVPITFVILHGGRTIVDSLNISEEKFLNLMIDHLKNPVKIDDKKSVNMQDLNFMLNKFVKNVSCKNGYE
ncbi:conserved protein, unknown function [Hepatocystis sp. ex Piliocolobus tephrosceles]|nr:conserved protein, unknown function [Hepatocystis sp. ex Piliocolobus tephrosceles]